MLFENLISINGAQSNTLFGYIPLLVVSIILIIIKGFALWKAARLKQKTWFWILIILNTMGILPMIYLIKNRNKKI